MPNTLELLTAMIEEDKITIQEVLEACGYKVHTVYKDLDDSVNYDEKIIATKEFR